MPPADSRPSVLLALAVAAALGRLPAQNPAGAPAAASPLPAAGPQDPPPPAAPQDRPSGDRPAAAPVVVTASRTAEDPFDAPRSIDVVTSERMQRANFRTLPQALRELPGVMVQETSPGQGSPFLRGFTGYGNVLLIDGIRLNNSTFRAGPNQYWATVDLLSAERIEVLRGPAATLYGSDAVGGTVQVFTKSPTVFGRDGLRYGGGLYGRYATAEDSVQARAEFQAGQAWADGTRTGFLVGGDAKAFGEVEGGRATGIQPNTDYDETALDAKVEHWLDERTRLVFLHQQTAMNNVPRTHATIFGESYAGSTVGTDRQRDLDQNRRLTYLQLHRTGMGGLFDGVHASVSYQEQREWEDRITGSGAQTWQGFSVGTVGAFLQFDSDLGDLGKLTWGADWYHDNVNSQFRRAGTPQPSDPIQGQVGNDGSYDLVGVFVQDRIALGDRAELQLGGRYTFAEASAGSVRDPSGNKIAVEDDWDEFTANAHLRYELVPDQWNVFGGVSQGFRAPTLSDLTQFDVARSGEAEVPAPGLDAEHYLGYEVGTKVRSGDVSGQAAWFYTDIEDQIQRFPTGATNGSGLPIVTKGNVGDGYVQGVELQYAWEFLERTTLFGNNTWQYGRIANFNSGGTQRTEEFVSRLMPFTTMVGVRWENAEGTFHAEAMVVRAEDADKTSAGDNRDTQRIPPGGTPGYTIAHLRCGWQIDERTSLDVGLENLTDVDYRVHGSGSNMPGRNFVIGMRTTF